MIGTLLRNSFNLNPAILSVVEVEMADSMADNNSIAVPFEESRRAPSEVSSTTNNVGVILAALQEGGDATVDWGSC